MKLLHHAENILSNLNVSLSRVISFLSLSSLILVNCNIDDHGVQILSQKKSDTKIQTFRLDFNKITDVGAACISGLVQECAGLLHLSISYNHIGDQGAMAIAGVLNHSLVELDLQNNSLNDEGAIAVAKSMKDFPREFHLFFMEC